METDSDLDSLREPSRFKALLKKIHGKFAWPTGICGQIQLLYTPEFNHRAFVGYTGYPADCLKENH